MLFYSCNLFIYILMPFRSWCFSITEFISFLSLFCFFFCGTEIQIDADSWLEDRKIWTSKEKRVSSTKIRYLHLFYLSFCLILSLSLSFSLSFLQALQCLPHFVFLESFLLSVSLLFFSTFISLSFSSISFHLRFSFRPFTL